MFACRPESTSNVLGVKVDTYQPVLFPTNCQRQCMFHEIPQGILQQPEM